jgi:hypothetical protein
MVIFALSYARTILSRLLRRAPQLLAAVDWVDKPSISVAHAGFPLKLQPSLHRLPTVGALGEVTPTSFKIACFGG